MNPGASASQANVGINNGILPPNSGLNSAATTVIQGAYYMHSGNNDSISGTTIVGGTLSGANIDSILSTAASDASAASTNLAGLANTQTPPSQIINSTTTIVGVAGRNVISIQQINLAAGMSLTLSGPPGASWVVNITGNGGNGGITLNAAQLLVGGGVNPADVIYNVVPSGLLRGADVTTSGNGVVYDGIIMNLFRNETFNAATVNGEAISNGNISFTNGGGVEVVATVPEASTTAYFTLGPLSLVAVMLLHRRFLRRKQSVVRCSRDPPESILGAVKWG